jgi:hypothetical protein
MNQRARLCLGVLMLAMGVTCAAQPPPAPAGKSRPPSTEPANATTWLLHLPGMGGLMNIDRNVTSGIVAGGVGARVEIYDWTGADRGLVALGNVKRHEEQAKLVAERIVRAVREDQPRPSRIVVTSHSAGTGIAIWALEQLPEDVMVDDLVMIASALSPEYDLSRALKHVRHRVYAFNSELDVLVLGTGCKMFGTVDRVKTDGAGRIGFVIPRNPAVADQYAKFEQFPYDPDWMRFYNNGEHIGAMTRAFARKVIAPVLLGKGLPERATTLPAPTAPTTRRAA